jgi:arylsulfatase A
VLYDLDNDVSESIDVSAEYPEIVEELKAAAERAREDLGDSNPPREGKGVRPAGML